jgi:DNA-binding NtrC family response regulator
VLHNATPIAREHEPGVSKLKEAERAAFAHLVESYAGDRAELAKHLGISARSLYRKLKELK